MGELSAIIGMLSAMDWNDCPRSIGIPVRNRRNPQPMPWFANKGQIVQVILATIGVCITLMIGLAIPPQSALYYLAPVAFTGCLVWAVWIIATAYTRSHLPIPSISEPRPPPLTTPSIPPIAEAK